MATSTVSDSQSSSALPAKLAAYFKEYASSHKHPTNKACHYFGLPAITLTTLGMLGAVPLFGGLTGSEFFRLDLGILVLFLGWSFYLSLDWKLGIPFALLTLGLYFMGRSLPLWANLVIWIIGWIVQFIGHGVYEKKSPAFLKSLEHLLIGPFWMFARLVGYIR